MLRLALLLGLGSNGQNTVSLVGNSSSIGRRSSSGATGTQICHNPGMYVLVVSNSCTVGWLECSCVIYSLQHCNLDLLQL